jgi:hypothetical protein
MFRMRSPLQLICACGSAVGGDGTIMAINIVNHGSNFTSTPSVLVNDSRCLCGHQVRICFALV